MSIERFHDFTAAMLVYKTMKQRSCWCREKNSFGIYSGDHIGVNTLNMSGMFIVM